MHGEVKKMMTRKGGTIRSNFETYYFSEYEKAIYGYVRHIVMKRLPL